MKVISLVPSLTMTAFDLGLEPKQLVGKTPWCIHPAEKVNHAMVVGGTKTPNLGKIMSLNPDIVLMDKEENPKEVYDLLKQNNIHVFVSEVTCPTHVPEMLESLGRELNLIVQAETLAQTCRSALERTLNAQKMWRTAPLIWHEPLMAVGPNRYSGALLSHVGFEVIDFEPDGNGYPEVSPNLMAAKGIELLLLTSEPHKFTMAEGESLIESMKHENIISHYRLINGEDLTWFGSRTVEALDNFSRLFQTLEMSNQTGR